MESHRTERVGALLRQAIAGMLLREVKDPRLTGVTITHVELSTDLRHARIFYRVVGADRDRELAKQGFARAAGYIQGAVGRELGLRYTPELRFAFDPGLDHALRLEQLLAEESGARPETNSELTESHGRPPTRR